MNPPSPPRGKLFVRGIALAVALGIWFAPVPEGLTPEAWHLFAIFGATILSVILTAFPLLTAAMIALAAAVLTGTVAPAKAFGGLPTRPSSWWWSRSW
jgi:di/tricarboxylate transporter